MRWLTLVILEMEVLLSDASGWMRCRGKGRESWLAVDLSSTSDGGPQPTEKPLAWPPKPTSNFTSSSSVSPRLRQRTIARFRFSQATLHTADADLPACPWIDPSLADFNHRARSSPEVAKTAFSTHHARFLDD